MTQDKTVAGRSPAKSYELSRPRPMPDSFRYASPYPHVPPAKEQPGGMFAEARKSGMDLEALGMQLLARKKQLQTEAQAA